MRTFMRESGGLWLAVGLVAGILLAPAAVGSAGLINIVGTNGKRAQVTPANQLQTAPASPAMYRNVFTPGIVSTCSVVFAAPAKSGAVVTSVAFNVWQNPAPGLGSYVFVSLNSACSGRIVTRFNPGGIGMTVVPFNPGFALKAGAKLYAVALGSVATELTVTGYLVPKAAVPATTPTARQSARAQG